MTTVAYISYYNGKREMCNLPIWKCFNKLIDDRRATELRLYTGEGTRTYRKTKGRIILKENK